MVWFRVRVVPEEVLAGTEIPRSWGRRRLYLTLHCHHQNDSGIKTGSDESRFNVSLIVRDKVAFKTVSAQTTTFEDRREPKWNRTELFLLAHTRR